MPVGKRTLWVGVLIGLVFAVAMIVLHHRDNATRDALMRADPEQILTNRDLAPAAMRIGRAGFIKYCAACHRDGRADQARGIPDLTDSEHLYGTGLVAEIEQIVLYGIRSGNPRGWNLAVMPAYASAKPSVTEPVPPMTPQQVFDITQFVMRWHARETDPAAAARGAALYAGSGGCWDCHAADGGGNDAIGAPSLVDDVWLYGDGSAASLARTISYGRHGVSPAFKQTLSPSDARAIAVYVAALARPQRTSRRN